MTVIDLATVGAVVLDTDGVVTDTARVRAVACKHVFDVFIRLARLGLPGEPDPAPSEPAVTGRVPASRP
ncbi:MAG: hypothetical protein K0R62_2813 [Nonomuraea muscovyensis]|nr:hypothetical protein [Nonomuraea muscovyensis]